MKAIYVNERQGLMDYVYTPKPVSYTHLDVYKRQPVFLLGRYYFFRVRCSTMLAASPGRWS